MAKINKQALKAYFKTGKIPTQSNFADLIDSVMNIPDKGVNSTLVLGNGDKNGAPYVKGYRFVTINDEASYLFIGFYDAANARYLPYIIVHCNTGSPSEYGNTPPVKYTILTSGMMAEMLLQGGELHSATDEVLVGAIPSNAKWNWVGCYHLSNTHSVIKNDLVEEHFFITTDSSERTYFKVVYAAENDTFPIVSEAIRVIGSRTAMTIYNYSLTSVVNRNPYKEELRVILDSADLDTTQLSHFIDKYMININVRN